MQAPAVGPVQTWLRFAVWLVAGLAIYGFYGRRHARLAVSPGRARP
ncbi:MAG: hypothetical protein GEU83_16445 [Pseudonocardiaceae bacterium]|nr:hypothetical protein [Pseudonocardiaceae bacterium]